MKHSVKTIEKPIWFVVNMCQRWNQDHIDRKRKPTIVFRSLGEAFAYACEMADQHCKGDYAVFECVGRVVSDKKNPPGKPGLKEKCEVKV